MVLDWSNTGWVVWVGVIAVVVVVALVVFWLMRRRTRETPMVALVRRRRELIAQLEELAGDTGPALLQAEARRQKASPSSIEVLEAAVARAAKN
jgi:anti-sigma-K factor RskA